MTTIKKTHLGDRHGWELHDESGRRVGYYFGWPSAGDARRDILTMKTYTSVKEVTT